MDINWYDYLDVSVYCRLCDRMTTRSDVQILVDAKWLYYQRIGRAREGFTKEDAAIGVLEMLDCNGCYFDLSEEEYNSLCGL